MMHITMKSHGSMVTPPHVVTPSQAPTVARIPALTPSLTSVASSHVPSKSPSQVPTFVSKQEVQSIPDANRKKIATRVSIFGTGYVGVTMMVGLAAHGIRVIAYDVNPVKLDMLRRGISPINEGKLPEHVRQYANVGIHVALSEISAVVDSDISFVSVGTPTADDGTVDLSQIKAVSASLGRCLKNKGAYHLFVIRSTVPIGTSRLMIEIIQNESGMSFPRDFGFCANPEFMREGTSLEDFQKPPFTIIGCEDTRSGDILETFYADIGLLPIHRMTFSESEVFKYLNNTFHALKITYANEVGRICAAHGIDAQRMMEVFCTDTKLNISKTYLRPGFAFGGYCLPKDLRGVLSIAQQKGVSVPVLDACLPSNSQHIEAAVRRIVASGAKIVGVWGIVFKQGTDDFRESPYLELLIKLKEKGIAVRVYEPMLVEERLLGANRQFLLSHVPDLFKIQVSKEALSTVDLLIIGSGNGLDAAFVKTLGKSVFDLNGLLSKDPPSRYERFV